MAVAGYFDQLSGFSADMLLGALIDAGLDREEIAAALKRHHGVDCEINVTRERVDGTQVTYASLSCVEASVPETYRNITDGGAGTPAGALIGKVIDRLEQNVEKLWGAQDHAPDRAQDHAPGHTPEHAPEHAPDRAPTGDELGGRLAALRILVLCNALHLHGIDVLYHEALPFAAGIDATPPLLAALMRGATVKPVDHAPVDLAGCAFLTALSAGPMLRTGFTLRSVGYGGNEADRSDGNMVRLCLGEVARLGAVTQSGDGESVQVLETQIDDMNPQFYSHVLDLLLDAGALDAFLTPVIMKKSRPGVLLTVLAPTDLAGRLSELVLKETTTIGLRSYPVSRSVLPRREARVETPFGAIRIKIVQQGDSTRYTPEYENCRQAALKAGIPLADVYAAVHEAVGSMDLDRLP